MAEAQLIMCSTPIGNLEDISDRAKRVLSEASLIACEDTRRARKLLTHLGIAAPTLVVYNEGNERRRADELLRRLKEGQTVVLMSDAGMPGLSDPGFRLVSACIESGIEVDVIPGPNAAISALVVSGLPPGRFTFEGFLPRKRSERRRHLETLVTEPRTLIIYESPHRVAESLEDLAAVLGDRPAAIVRELTKLHQEVRRGSLADLAAGAKHDPVRGEVVLVIHGATGTARQQVAPTELARRARELMDAGVERSGALKIVARDAGVAKRDVFDALLSSQLD